MLIGYLVHILNLIHNQPKIQHPRSQPMLYNMTDRWYVQFRCI